MFKAIYTEFSVLICKPALKMDITTQQVSATLSRHSLTMEAGEYRRRFCDVERFENLCKVCPNYARQWSCPPLSPRQHSRLAQYPRVTLVIYQITVPADYQGDFGELLQPYKQQLSDELQQMEKQLQGRACHTIGRCTFCGDMPCARISDEPCRHPELVRPSLEAYGFDLGATAAELFKLPIFWSKDGSRPPYQLLIAAVFH